MPGVACIFDFLGFAGKMALESLIRNADPFTFYGSRITDLA